MVAAAPFMHALNNSTAAIATGDGDGHRGDVRQVTQAARRALRLSTSTATPPSWWQGALEAPALRGADLDYEVVRRHVCTMEMPPNRYGTGMAKMEFMALTGRILE
jgi:hypothetical protein